MVREIVLAPHIEDQERPQDLPMIVVTSDVFRDELLGGDWVEETNASDTFTRQTLLEYGT